MPRFKLGGEDCGRPPTALGRFVEGSLVARADAVAFIGGLAPGVADVIVQQCDHDCLAWAVTHPWQSA